MTNAAVVIDDAESFWSEVERFLFMEDVQPGAELPVDLEFRGWPNLQVMVPTY